MKRIFLIPILFFISVVVFAYYVLPKLFVLKNLEAGIKSADSFLKQENDYYSNLEAISERIGFYKNEIEKINSALPDGPQAASLFEFLQSKSSANGLILSTVSQPGRRTNRGASQKTPENKLKQAYFNITVHGTFSSINNFIKDIENSSRMIEIEQLTISPKKSALSKKNGYDFLSADLSLKVYYY